MKNMTIKISKEQVWNINKPKYNAYQFGYGIHGDTKYNRRKSKKELCRQIDEYYK